MAKSNRFCSECESDDLYLVVEVFLLIRNHAYFYKGEVYPLSRLPRLKVKTLRRNPTISKHY
jgi:hypothetical protein